MQIFYNLNEWQQIRKNIPNHLSIGFIPTMGNLHIGHASLISTSTQENDITVVSIFVNQTQFNNQEDFINYPRTLDNDLKLLQDAGVDYCLIPNYHDIYTDDYRYQLSENKLSLILEGEHRPGHFTGVLTVVMKLFNLIKPNCSYFGEKDYQQAKLILDMTKSFFMDINVKICPTIRAESGLAYSSRNNRLSPSELLLANKFAEIFHNLDSCEEIIRELSQLNIKVDYIKDSNDRRYAAVIIGSVRLIDNKSLAT